jgi:hypothetical protein
MIMSVSTLTIGSGAATPVSLVNLSMGASFGPSQRPIEDGRGERKGAIAATPVWC